MKIARVKYSEDYYLVFYTGFNKKMNEVAKENGQKECENDIQVVLEDKFGNRLDDAICHYGSYGVEENTWEVMSGNLRELTGDSVKGYLTWKEVEAVFDETIRKRRVGNIVDEILNSENNNGFGVKVGAIVEASKKYGIDYKILLEEIMKRGEKENE